MLKNWIKKDKKNTYIIGLFITVVCCMLYAAMVSLYTLPITEGWYTEYAWLINHGKLPYRDFEYLFPPLYLFFIAGFTKIFGYSILALRILGVIIFGGIAATFYIIFSKVYNNVAGIIAAICSVLYLQSENAQIFYDYVRVHDLVALIAIALLIFTTKTCIKNENIKNNKYFCIFRYISCIFAISLCFISISILGITRKLSLLFLAVGVILIMYFGLLIMNKKDIIPVNFPTNYSLYAFFLGIFLAAEFMIKQSNGSLMIVFTFIYLLFCAVVYKNRNFVDYLIGVCDGIILIFSIVLCYLICTQSLNAFFDCVFLNAISAKGGITNELFRWIPSAWGIFCQQKNTTILVVVIFELLYKKWEKTSGKSSDFSKICFVFVNVFLLIVTIVLNVKNADFYANNALLKDDTIPYVSFFIGTIAFFILGIYLLYQAFCPTNISILTNDEYNLLILVFPLLGAAFATGYGCAMSGGLATSQTSLMFGTILGLGVFFVVESANYIYEILITLIAIIMCSSFIALKSSQPYYWWGITQNSLSENTELINVPILSGIKVSEQDKNCFETVYNDVIQNTTEEDNIFSFPHSPIFYTMTNRHSKTYSKVQWFDVSSVNSIEKDIEVLRNDHPKILVYVSAPDSVYESHEELFNCYQTREMRDFLLDELIPDGDYQLLDSCDIGGDYSVNIYLRTVQ